MTATQAKRYLRSTGMSEEQIKAVCEAFEPAVREAFEPKEAIWLPDFDNNGRAWICSECGAWVVFRHPYCAWCGGKMKRSEEE